MIWLLHTIINSLLFHKQIVEEKIRKCGAKILFVHTHIPKTGGTSLSDVLRSCAAQHNKKFAYGHLNNFLNMSKQEQDEIIAIDAHMGYGIKNHPNFPIYRKDCIIYFAVMRPYVDIIWSAMGHKYYAKENISPNKITSFIQLNNPWNFQGAISYQLCCFSDPQHPEGFLYSKGNLVKQVSKENFYIEKDCPKSIEEASLCAVKRLCNDYDIIGNTYKLSELIQTINDVLKCKGNVQSHSNSHSLLMKNDSFKHLVSYLKNFGSSFDTAVLKFGMMLSDGDIKSCNTPLTSLQMHMK